jgi:activator of 2-hydroxyglutaryl-CoA dehydratase/predicted nucleotide-binding protein (sugar kinase/HSP70/actin superfamily)
MTRRTSMVDELLSIGMDIGSTTVKTVVVDDRNRILWKRYDRHETRQAETLRSQLASIQESFAGHPMRFFITGSGSASLVPVVGATFIQEVNAIELAVETLYPDTGSVIELGGQDAKIIVWKTDSSGNKRSVITMNDKCAGGTGATIDRILVKAGIDPVEAMKIPYSEDRIHKIAARCGVFAETDVVGLLKMGISQTEIVPSLFAAIAKQNLEVLTRGNVLRDKIVLLGGPNRFFPGLVECWRAQIPRHWEERKYAPADLPLEQLITCPRDAEYFAALGSVLYGNYEREYAPMVDGNDDPTIQDTCPLDRLDAFIRQDRVDQLSSSGKARRALVQSEEEKETFLAAYSVPEFRPRKLQPGETVRAYVGIDGGSTSTKAVLLDEEGELLNSAYALSAGNPLQDTKIILDTLRTWATDQGAHLEILGAGATGYAGRILEETLSLDAAIVETVAHMLSALKYYGNVDVICDVGGQDIKIIFLKDGKIKDFRFNTQCSAGNGYFLQSMAKQFNIPLEKFAEHAFRARIAPSFHYGCAVFMEQDKVNLQQLGWSPEEMLAGLALVLPLNIWQYIAKVPNIGRYGKRFVLQGGTQKNLAAVKAQIDYVKERIPDAEIFVHRHAAESGAIGAALEARQRVLEKGESSFVGLDEAIDLTYETRNDESTRCTFCSNACSRTFIDSRTPSGRTSRYISGFACEKGSVESKEAMKAIARNTRRRCQATPNLAHAASRKLFEDYDFEPLPDDGHCVEEEVEVVKPRFLRYGRRTKEIRLRRFQGASPEVMAQRRSLTVGIPRVLTQYHSAPYFSTFLRTLGVGNVVFSSTTSDRLWEEGGKWGTIDPCFPAKVANAHVHDLLRNKKVDAILFPMIECFESHLTEIKGCTACSIQTATPEVVHASFTKEKDYFAEASVEYWKPHVNLERRREAAEEMYEYFRDLLGVSRDEAVHASEQGFAALDEYRRVLRNEGRRIIDRAVAENDVVVVMLGRPYHNDPGVNHGILRQFQLRGYPVIGIESLPVDDEFLVPLFRDEQGRVDEAGMRGVLDVWKRAYNFGGNHKMWAAKVVARHPNLVAVELASFKCGYDYSISTTLENIAGAVKSPYFKFHDLDQKKSESALNLRIDSITYFLDRLRNNIQNGRLGLTAPQTEARV